MGLDANDASALADALKVNTTLTSLYVSSGNDIGVEGVKALADALKVNTTLTCLSASGNDIDDEGAMALAAALKVNTTLTSLDATGNKIGANGAKALANALKDKTTRLTGLNLGNNDIGVSGVKALADALRVNITLTTQFVGYNDIGHEGAAALATVLKDTTTLTCLDVSRNKIGDDGVKALVKAFKDNTTLTILDVSRNEIEEEGVKALANAIKDNSTLTRLDVSHNEIGDEGAAVLANALKDNTTLTSLNVVGIHIGAEGVKALARALKDSTTLTNLNVGYNKIGAKGADALINSLKDNTTLTSIQLGGFGDIELKKVGIINNWIERNRVLKDHSIAWNDHSEGFYMKVIVTSHNGEARTDLSWSTGLWKREVAYIGVGDEYVEKQWQFNDRTGIGGESEEALSTHALTKETCLIWEVATGDGMLCKFVLDAFKIVLEKTLDSQRAIKDLVDSSRNESGMTLLHLAARLDSKEALDLCKFLVDDVGVDFDTFTDNKGRIALDIALGNGNAGINAWAKTVGTLFGRYRVEGGKTAHPAHKSATCTVLFAVGVLKKNEDPNRNVALKIMKKKLQMDRELNIRLRGFVSVAEGEDVPDMNNHFDSAHAVPLLRYHIKNGNKQCLCLVMSRGEKNLHHIIDSEQIAGKDLDKIYAYGKDMAMALEHLHSGIDVSIAHGDFKPRNVVRINGDLKLIDFDASFAIGDELSETFSTGYIPPELARSKFDIKDITEMELIQQIDDSRKQLEEALHRGAGFAEVAEVSRLSIAYTTLSQKLDLLQNGQDISETARVTMDIWAFGVNMYYLCTGKTLFSCDLNDAIIEESELLRLINWEGLSETHLDKVLKDLQDQLSPETIPCATVVGSDYKN
jgi:Ran GTPase-activating protein (RanGAP) involved in mRNA processing and transport/serine/threonine protein kinase